MQGRARLDLSSCFHLLPYSELGNWIHIPMSLYKLFSLYTCMSVLYQNLKFNKHFSISFLHAQKSSSAIEILPALLNGTCRYHFRINNQITCQSYKGLDGKKQVSITIKLSLATRCDGCKFSFEY